MAGHRRGDLVEPLGEPRRRRRHSARSSAMSRTSAAASISPSSAGVSVTATAPGPNGSSTRPSAASASDARQKPCDILARQLDDLRDQQDLASAPSRPRVPPSAARRRCAHARRAGRRSPARPPSARRCSSRGAAPAPRRAAASGLRRDGGMAPARASAEGRSRTAKPPARLAEPDAGGPAPPRQSRSAPAQRCRPSGRKRGQRRRPAARSRPGSPARASASRIAPIRSPRTMPGIAEAHLQLGRMDVHVDLAGRHVEEERGDGKAVARQHVGIGGAQRAGEERIAERPPVDEEELLQRIGAVEGRQPGMTRRAARPRATRRASWRCR